ncbi:thiamine ABC transporter substrate-binding protein [Actinomyces capricornis]|uniref:Thiamine ABC transporter substrate-binding protein n=1 Tax=Actinomyces capricornis TaxID=2755559 RepID=A0ABN6K4J6_9ACTO|nr:thiamine ABC transporter substrate-binding protein [Actinomyces capricornis]BDA64445.1 thiamine ABC transporter substrate-binding protein [Actinomyces capricornis]
MTTRHTSPAGRAHRAPGHHPEPGAPGPARYAPSRRRLLGGAAAGALGLALAACGSGGSGGSGAGGGASVTVLTHDSFKVSDDLISAFEADTGYTLSLVASGDAGELVNKLVLTKDAPLGDAFFGIDNTYASRALAEGIVDQTVTVTLPDGAEAYLVDDTPALAPIDVGDVCLNIDTAYFADKGLSAPATFEDLLKSEYKNLLVAIDPSTSSPGMAWMLATVGHFGADGFAEYWKSLVANGARIDAGWTDAYYTDFTAGGGEGAYPIVVSYASSPSYTLTEDKSATTTAALLDTAFRQVEYAGVLTGAANPEGGRAFVEWMLSTKVQEDIPGQMYMYPVDGKAALPTELERFGPLAEAPIEVSAADITANRETWLQAWTQAAGS